MLALDPTSFIRPSLSKAQILSLVITVLMATHGGLERKLVPLHVLFIVVNHSVNG